MSTYFPIFSHVGRPGDKLYNDTSSYKVSHCFLMESLDGLLLFVDFIEKYSINFHNFNPVVVQHGFRAMVRAIRNMSFL